MTLSRWQTPSLVRRLTRDRLQFFRELWEEHGDVVRIPLGHRTFYLINDADHIETILRGNHKNFRKAAIFNDERRAALGDSLLTSHGDFWLRQRRLSQPSFQPRALDSYVESMVRITGGELGGLADEVEIAGPLTTTTIRIASEILFGVDLGEEAEAISDAVHAIVDVGSSRIAALTKMPLWWPSSAHRRFRRGLDYLDQLIYRIIDRPESTGNDVLSRLIRARDEETGQGMTREALRDEVVTFLIAGHESTAAGLAWTTLLLGTHPEVQARVRAEVAEVLGDRAPSAADLPRLEYTTWVVQESMRLYPPSWLFDRETIGPEQLGEHRLSPGSTLLIVPYTLHRHPRHWPDPERFDPLRFSPAQAAGATRSPTCPSAPGRASASATASPSSSPWWSWP